MLRPKNDLVKILLGHFFIDRRKRQWPNLRLFGAGLNFGLYCMLGGETMII